jgi:hypothetical protein
MLSLLFLATALPANAGLLPVIDLAALAQPMDQTKRPANETLDNPIRVHVTDPKGNPVSTLYVQDGRPYLRGDLWVDPFTVLMGVATVKHPREVMSDPDGNYTVPCRALLWSEGTSVQAVSRPYDEILKEPVAVILHPKQYLTLRVLTPEGERAPDIRVVPVGFYHYNRPQWVAYETGPKGQLHFDYLPPGDYIFGIDPTDVEFGDPLGLAFVTLPPGEDVVATVTVRYPYESGHGMLRTLLQKMETLRGGDWKPLWDAYDPEEQGMIAAAVVEELEQGGQVIRQNHEKIDRLATIASALQLEAAVAPLQRLFKSVDADVREMLFYRGSAMAFAIAQLAGNDAVPWFAAASQDLTLSPAQRQMSVMMLGQIGTKYSVATYIRLREAARARVQQWLLPGLATDRDRIVDALRMTLAYIPQTEEMAPIADSLEISEDGKAAKMSVGNLYAGLTRSSRAVLI